MSSALRKRNTKIMSRDSKFIENQGFTLNGKVDQFAGDVYTKRYDVDPKDNLFCTGVIHVEEHSVKWEFFTPCIIQGYETLQSIKKAYYAYRHDLLAVRTFLKEGSDGK